MPASGTGGEGRPPPPPFGPQPGAGAPGPRPGGLGARGWPPGVRLAGAEPSVLPARTVWWCLTAAGGTPGAGGEPVLKQRAAGCSLPPGIIFFLGGSFPAGV